MDYSKLIFNEHVPGMRAQAEGIKVYVKQEGAPLKAVAIGDPSALYFPDTNVDEGAAAVLAKSPHVLENLNKLAGRNMWDVNPEYAEKLAANSDALANAYRQAGVKLLRNESGKTPDEIVNLQTGWGGPKFNSILAGQPSWEVFGHCMVKFHEHFTFNAYDMVLRDAVLEMMINDPEAVWLYMPPAYPTLLEGNPPPRVSPGDPKLLADNNIVVGIGVAEESHIHDLAQPRSASDEFGAEILRRMLEPFGFKVHTIYYDRNLTYHLDAFMGVVDESTVAMPKDYLFGTLPDFMKDYKIIDVLVEDQQLGCMNSEVLNKGELLIPQGTKQYANDLRKHGVEPVEIDYSEVWGFMGSGIHCSSAAIWRE